MGEEFVSLSLVPITIGAFSSLACTIPGNFLILRKQALIGDAISHVVLPGIVVAFLFTGQVTTWPMLIGATIAAIIAVVLIEITQRVGNIEPGAAMGVIFTAMFAAGVLLLEQSDTSNVHLDVEHALFGNLESLIWMDAVGWSSLIDPKALITLPSELYRISFVLFFIGFFVFIFWRPLVLTSFDEEFGRSIGIPVSLLGLSLVSLTAIAAVASFDAVGSIIVISMIICPPAAARLLTNRIGTQTLVSLLIAFFSTIIGYVIAGYVPIWLGFSQTLSAAGTIATISGICLAISAIFGPHRKSTKKSI